MTRNKLTVEEQILHMEKNGISFNLISKQEAESFLSNNSYYFKLKAFAKNYDKIETSFGESKYVNLDFAYLKELSIIDMHLRKIIFSMTSDIEHFLKAKLLYDCSDNNRENGYSIVHKFLKRYSYIQNSIAKKCNNSATSDLVIKYCDSWAIWNIVEVLSFGDFLKLYKLYCELYPNNIPKFCALDSLRFLRNAAAHNNCLINSIKRPYMQNNCTKSICMYGGFTPTPKSKIKKTKELSTEIAKHQIEIGISSNVRKKRLSNPVVHDLTALIYIYPQICSKASSLAIKSQWLTFFDRCLSLNFREN